MNLALQFRVSRIQFWVLAVGLIGLGCLAYGATVDRRQFFFSYLFGYLFWLGVSLGCFLISMIHQLTGGRWGYPTRRFFEAGFLALPLMLVLFIPLCFGLPELYPWARPDVVAADKVLLERHAYQNPATYIGRSVAFLLIWIWMAYCLRKWSRQQDLAADAAPTRKARALSGIGIVLYGLLATAACVDWIMSLEAHWYSTLFAVIFIIGQVLAAFAFAIVLLTLFRAQEPFAETLNKTHYHHLGNLLLTFVLFWTYISFGQLLIIYSGDLPDELKWYLHRIAGHWKAVVWILAAFHFFLPFFLLLFRGIKRHVAPLAVLAGLIFVMHLLDVYWMVMPSLHSEGMDVSWQDFAAPMGIGGVWLAYFLSRLKAAPLLPQQDPGMQFAFTYGP